jgi:hypothetical protein
MVATDPVPDPTHQVLCIGWDRGRAADDHEHVRFVDTRDPDGSETRWNWIDVVSAIRDGAEFVVAADPGVRRAVLEPTLCPKCSLATLDVHPTTARAESCA